MGGKAHNKQRYYEGFEQYLNQLISHEPASIEKLFTIEALLKEPNIDVNMSDLMGDKPLDIAVEVDYPFVIWMLIQAGARFEHLNNDQQNQLIQSFEFLYMTGNITKDSIEKVENQHNNIPRFFKNKLYSLLNEFDAMSKQRLFSFQYFSNVEDNYEKLFMWLKGQKEPINLSKINEYITFSFKYFLLSYQDLKYFYSLPIKDRLDEFERLHRMQIQTYEDIKKFTTKFVKEVSDHLIDFDKTRKNKVDLSVNKTNKKLEKKALKKELKKQGLSQKQIKMRVHSQALLRPVNTKNFSVPIEELQEQKSNNSVNIETVPSSIATVDCKNDKDSLTESLSALESLTEIKKNSAVSSDDLKEQFYQELATKILNQLKEKFKSSDFKIKENEVIEYILNLIKTAKENLIKFTDFPFNALNYQLPTLKESVKYSV